VVAVTQKRLDKRLPKKPVLAVWVGDSAAAREIFTAAGIPSYLTEADAVAGFMHVVRYQESLKLLMATPPSVPEEFVADTEAARKVIDGALREKRRWLDPMEAVRRISRAIRRKRWPPPSPISPRARRSP
jgi:acetyltransferase